MPLTIVPSIDLRDGKVVRLKQGDYSRQINYDVDPIETAKSFKRDGAQWLHVVDLDGAKQGIPVQTDLIAQIIKASGLKVQTGGGVRTTQDVNRLLDAGASRVVIGTAAMENWKWFEELVRLPGHTDRVVLAIDAKDGIVATHGWMQTSHKSAVDIAQQVSDWPLAGLLYTDVAKDGMMTGPNFAHTQKLALASKVPVIASGGVGNIDHIRQLLDLSVWGVIVGRSLYEGTLNLRDAIAAAR